MFVFLKNNLQLFNHLKNKNIKKKKRLVSTKVKPRVTSPSLTTFNAASHSMISIISRIFAVLTVISFSILVIFSPLYEIYTWNTIWFTYTWFYKEVFFIFSLTGHIITYLLHKKMSKKN